MRCSTTGRSALLAGLLLLLGLGSPASPPGIVTGEADGLYRLEAPPGAPPPPAATALGFRQTVSARQGAWEIAVSVRPAPPPGTVPLRPDWSHPALSDLPAEFVEGLRREVPAGRAPADTLAALADYLRSRIRYEPIPREREEPAAVCREGHASCVGLARLAADILLALGYSCEPVVGLRAPADGAPLALEGGALHVWLSIRTPGGSTCYFDPAYSSGWVPERYIVLREGGGWGPGDLARLRGGSLRTLWRRDRLFFFPADGDATRIWTAAPLDGLSEAAVSGKLLDGTDAPLAGTAYLRGPGGVFALPLWQGNFCFRDLLPGDYELALESDGVRVGLEAFTLAPMDKRTLVIYSRDGRGRGAGHGTGRQSGGPLPP